MICAETLRGVSRISVFVRRSMLRTEGTISQIILVAAALMMSSLCTSQSQQLPRLKPMPPQHKGKPKAQVREVALVE
jgi:hypothetical protein